MILGSNPFDYNFFCHQIQWIHRQPIVENYNRYLFMQPVLRWIRCRTMWAHTFPLPPPAIESNVTNRFRCSTVWMRLNNYSFHSHLLHIRFEWPVSLFYAWRQNTVPWCKMFPLFVPEWQMVHFVLKIVTCVQTNWCRLNADFLSFSLWFLYQRAKRLDFIWMPRHVSNITWNPLIIRTVPFLSRTHVLH